MFDRFSRQAMRMALPVTVAAGLFTFAMARPAEAVTVSFGASKDTTIFQNNPTYGAGGAAGLFAGTNSGNPPSPRRGLVDFNVSPIPNGATITDVQLRLVIGQIAGSGGGGGSNGPTIGVYKLDVGWGEANTGALGDTSVSGGGQGSLALTGDSTWNDRFFDATNPVSWTVPGGKSGTDYEAAASASLVQGNTVGSVSIWETSQLTNDVQGWVDSPATNNGWMLINADESSAQTFRAFYSKDYNPLPTDPNFGNLPNLVPQLIVTYSVPEPSGAVLLLLAMNVLVPLHWSSRRRQPV